MKLIRFTAANDIDVEFLDEHHFIKPRTTYSNFIVGAIKNPFDKIVQRRGYIGIGPYPTDRDGYKEIYNCWHNMLDRCYDDRLQDENRSYFGYVECVPEWFNYQEFARWFEENKYAVDGRLHIDKDILYPGNKIYSPYHCLLVPQRINMLFLNKQNSRGLPNGIMKKGDLYYASYNKKHLGVADTIEEAYELYANEKKKAIVAVAEEFKHIVPTKVYEALMSYEVRIENDKNYNPAN